MSRPLPVRAPRPASQLPLPTIGLVLLLGGASYLATLGWPLLFPQPEFNAAALDCDLTRGPCSAAFDDKRFVRLTMRPQDFSPTAVQPAIVETGGLAVDAVTIEFTGVDMNMGLISHDLIDAGGGAFAGDVVLPACVRRRMTWRALVTVEADRGIHHAEFRFEVNRR